MELLCLFCADLLLVDAIACSVQGPGLGLAQPLLHRSIWKNAEILPADISLGFVNIGLQMRRYDYTTECMCFCVYVCRCVCCDVCVLLVWSSVPNKCPNNGLVKHIILYMHMSM